MDRYIYVSATVVYHICIYSGVCVCNGGQILKLLVVVVVVVVVVVLATLVWTFEGGQVPANSEVVVAEPGKSSLLLSRVTEEENGGVYACLGHLGQSSRTAVTVELVIYGEVIGIHIRMYTLETCTA